MKMRADAYFLMAIMAMMLIAIWALVRTPSLSAKLIPLIISSAVLVLAAVALVNSVRPKRRAVTTAKQDSEDATKESMPLRGLLAAGGWIVGFFLGIYLLGLVAAIGLFVFSYMKSHHVGWLTSIILTVFILAFTYGIFQVGLRIQLYEGAILIWLGY